MKRFIILLHSAFFLFIVWSCDQGGEAVAQIGNEKITGKQFREVLRTRYPSRKPEEISLEERQKVLQSVMENEFKYIRAKELGLDTLPDFVKHIRIQEERIIAAKLSEILIVDRFVSDEMIEANLLLKKGRAEVILGSVAFQGIPGINVKRSREEAIRMTQDIINQAESGVSLSQLIETYSNDTRLQNRKGILSPYPAGSFPPQVDSAVYLSPPGKVFGPVVTDQGVYFGKINRREIADPDILTRTEKIREKQIIYNNHFFQQGVALTTKLTEEFKKEIGWEISSEGIDKFLRIMDEWAELPEARDDSFTEEQRSIYLGRAGKDTLTCGDFIDEFQNTFSANYQRFNSHQDMEEILTDLIQYRLWVAEARKHKVNELSEIREKIETFRKNKLVEVFEREEIGQKSVPTEEEIVKYYEENRSRYMAPRQIHLSEIAVHDSLLALEILKKARKNPQKFLDLYEQYDEKDVLEKRRGDLGYQPEKSPRLVVKKAFEAGENQISGPIHEFNFYYVIKTGDIKPPRQQELSEVKLLVRAHTQQQKQEDLFNEHVREFQQKNVYRVNESVLKRIR